MIRDMMRVDAGAVLLLLGALSACSGDGAEPLGAPEQLGAEEAAEWEAFRADALRTSEDGEEYFVVEWDLPIRSEAELWEYYSSRSSNDVDKGVLHLNGGADDVWADGDQLHLRYCIDAGFDETPTPTGLSFATVRDAMAAARVAWMQTVNVNITYDSANNGSCATGSAVPDNLYIKVSRANALSTPCAFGPQSHAGWTCPGLDGFTIGIPESYSPPAPFDWPGTLMHEMGHVLGLHHEQFHTNGGGCTGTDVRNVSAAADATSIMGYPSGSTPGGCGLVTPGGTALSLGDGTTTRTFYGSPASWISPLLHAAF